MTEPINWGEEVERTESEMTKHIDAFLDEMKQKPDVLKALNDLADKHGLAPLTEKDIMELLYGRQVGQARKRKSRKTRRKHGKRISRK